MAYLKKIQLIKATGQGVIPKSAKGVSLTSEEIDGTAYKGITVGTLCDDYLAHIQDPHNHDRPKDQVNPPHRIAAIKDAFGDRPAASVVPYEVVDWLKSLNKAPATLNRYRSTFSGVFRYGNQRAKLSGNPVRETTQHRVVLPNPRWLHKDEEKAMRLVLARWVKECPAKHRLKKLYLRIHPSN